MSWFLIWAITYMILLAYSSFSIMFAIRNKVYQKRWEQEKSMRMRMRPFVSNAELYEQYIMFCKRNDCKVDF